MSEFYPWELERLDGPQCASVLWSTFRNPFAHSLGLAFEKRGRERRLEPRGFQTKIGRDKPSMSERAIVALERAWERPKLNRTVVIADHKRVLWVEPLYWGVRKMIYRLTCDRSLMREVQSALDEDVARHEARSVPAEPSGKTTV